MPYQTVTNVPTSSGSGTASTTRCGCGCPSCSACDSLQCLCRPRFFAGQLITDADFRRLDQYLVGKDRLHNKFLHGSDAEKRDALDATAGRPLPAVTDIATVGGRQVEWFYDTRYDGWARTLYKLGPTITAGPHFRYEIYVAHQEDRLPSKSDLDALGLNLKWYY